MATGAFGGKPALRAAALLLAAGPAAAATIYGSLSQPGGQPLAQTALELRCGNEVSQGKTDARGSFRFTVPQTGRCELRVAGGGEVQVIVYNEPTRYDYELRRVDGRPVLARR